MRRTMIAATALAAVAAIAAPGASAGGSFETGVVLLNTENVGDNYLAYGVLTSDKGKCRGNRKLQMLIDPGGGYEVRDTGRSSGNGAWALQADSSDATGIRAKVRRKELPNGDVCQAASVDVPF